ncbi:MAG TPA: hypothetical protein VKY56_04415, partial [Chloroflexota bacterium]|nr:hypothetical protein [Chloroflexota bacterium]
PHHQPAAIPTQALPSIRHGGREGARVFSPSTTAPRRHARHTATIIVRCRRPAQAEEQQLDDQLLTGHLIPNMGTTPR